MTNLVTASEPTVTESGATVTTIPVHLDSDWVQQAITELGPLSVAQVVKLSGRSETTARKLLKALVADGTLCVDTEAKPATYELIIDTTAAADEDEEDELEPEELEDEAKLDDLMAAITAPPKETPKSKKVAHTSVPDERNEYVQLGSLTMFVTSAYAKLVDPPMFENALDAYGWANTARDRAEGEHTPQEIAGLYFDVVSTYIEEMLDNGDITRSVWYGRTFRLRRTLIGNGKGTAAAKPAKTTTTGE